MTGILSFVLGGGVLSNLIKGRYSDNITPMSELSREMLFYSPKGTQLSQALKTCPLPTHFTEHSEVGLV